MGDANGVSGVKLLSVFLNGSGIDYSFRVPSDRKDEGPDDITWSDENNNGNIDVNELNIGFGNERFWIQDVALLKQKTSEMEKQVAEFKLQLPAIKDEFLKTLPEANKRIALSGGLIHDCRSYLSIGETVLTRLGDNFLTCNSEGPNKLKGNFNGIDVFIFANSVEGDFLNSFKGICEVVNKQCGETN
jgi:hypothetical protein